MGSFLNPEYIDNVELEDKSYLKEEDLDLVSGGRHDMHFVCQACGAQFDNRSDWLNHRRESGHYRGP